MICGAELAVMIVGAEMAVLMFGAELAAIHFGVEMAVMMFGAELAIAICLRSKLSSQKNCSNCLTVTLGSAAQRTRAGTYYARIAASTKRIT